jgi:hypothetical protein
MQSDSERLRDLSQERGIALELVLVRYSVLVAPERWSPPVVRQLAIARLS